ncbi:UDP-glucose flavonoid 3-O-glucosyltransferase 7-like [Glycine soja]|uniref:UDP-glucose flavonoid 3-O-glucosyltransferase 7-like n=1 Tax=Glycine soja TaxID=3848 RepID=UPI001038E1DF|nr:UDP-glucose flavonoid 3-O-glucosyltransferase 7-like [Glycine soja]
MDVESSFSQIAHLVFDGKSYDLWKVKLKSYMESFDLWDAMEENYEVSLLPENPTMTVATGQLFQMETVVAAADALLLSVAPHIPWMCLHQPCCNHKRLKQEKMVKFKRGWVPQVLILEHEAIGVFVTHCGWNSSLEAVNAGVPMITWPMGADQIFNEKLVTEVLKIGMPIGARKLFRLEGDSITCDAVEEAVKRIMIGEEAIEMRNRTKVPSQLAKQAMKGGGSSFTELEALVEELSSLNY